VRRSGTTINEKEKEGKIVTEGKPRAGGAGAPSINPRPGGNGATRQVLEKKGGEALWILDAPSAKGSGTLGASSVEHVVGLENPGDPSKVSPQRKKGGSL